MTAKIVATPAHVPRLARPNLYIRSGQVNGNWSTVFPRLSAMHPTGRPRWPPNLWFFLNGSPISSCDTTCVCWGGDVWRRDCRMHVGQQCESGHPADSCREAARMDSVANFRLVECANNSSRQLWPENRQQSTVMATRVPCAEGRCHDARSPNA
jgi:hypothetical protein